MSGAGPHVLVDPQAKLLADLAGHPSPAMRLSDELRAALVAGAKALEREARAREYDRGEQ